MWPPEPAPEHCRDHGTCYYHDYAGDDGNSLIPISRRDPQLPQPGHQVFLRPVVLDSHALVHVFKPELDDAEAFSDAVSLACGGALEKIGQQGRWDAVQPALRLKLVLGFCASNSGVVRSSSPDKPSNVSVSCSRARPLKRRPIRHWCRGRGNRQLRHHHLRGQSSPKAIGNRRGHGIGHSYVDMVIRWLDDKFEPGVTLN